MKIINKIVVVLFLIGSCGYLFAKKPNLFFKNEETGLEASIKAKVVYGSDYAAGGSLLNKDTKNVFGDSIDKSIVQKAKIDLTAHLLHEQGIESQATVRMRVPWGGSRNFTSSDSIKLNETYFGDHTHTLNINVLYLQEMWVDILYYETHCLSLGMFSFELGRGIALGDAFMVNPTSLGYYNDKSVDQYAPGVCLSGDFFTPIVKYDTYVSILKNKSASLRDTGALIYDQLVIGGKYASNLCLGFGKINWLAASRVKIMPIDEKETYKKVMFEPYFLYASDPTQKVSVPFDAKGTLITLGLAGECGYEAFEFGFDAAINRGSQDVFGWDNNKLKINSSGVQIFSDVYDDAALTTNTPYSKSLVSTVRPSTGTVSSALNGTQIDTIGKFSSKSRFRDPYTNKYKGWMCVADTSLYIYKRNMSASLALGIASGDVNPHRKTGAVRDYNGFLSLQEMYAGKRVKSFFVMGPASTLIRSTPFISDIEDQFVSSVDNFSNIVFAGGGLTCISEKIAKKIIINPNVIQYWTHVSTLNTAGTGWANKHLGIELNIFMKLHINDSLVCNAMGAVFLPGKHYGDIKGSPLDSQKKDLIQLTDVGLEDTLPTLGNDTVFTLSLSLEYLV